MIEMRRNFLVGAFVLVGMVALGALVILFGENPTRLLRTNVYTIGITFDSASGVRPGTLVNIQGIPVGRVSDVRFIDPSQFDRGVIVKVSLNPGYKIPRGSVAQTFEPGLGMGRPPIEITPGPADAPVLASGDTIAGHMTKAVESLIPPALLSSVDRTATQLGEAAAALTPVLVDMHEMLQPREVALVDLPTGPPGNLSTAMARFDKLVKHFNTVMGDPETQSQLKASIENLHAMSADGRILGGDLKVAAGDLKQASADARAFVSHAQTALDKVESNIDHVARTTIDDLEIAGRVLERFQTVTDKMAKGEGTIGRLLTDDKLYEAMVQTFRRLAESGEEFRDLVRQWREGKVRIGL